MFTKLFVLAIMLIILVALGSGLFFLVRDESGTKRTVKALSVRIGLSVCLFLFLLLAFHFGLIKPHGL